MNKYNHTRTSRATSNTDQKGLQNAIALALAKERTAKVQQAAQQGTQNTERPSVVVIRYEAHYYAGAPRRLNKLESTDLVTFKKLVTQFQKEYPKINLSIFQIETVQHEQPQNF